MAYVFDPEVLAQVARFPGDAQRVVVPCRSRKGVGGGFDEFPKFGILLQGFVLLEFQA